MLPPRTSFPIRQSRRHCCQHTLHRPQRPSPPARGSLGACPPEESARRVRDEATVDDALNGDRGVVPAIDLIYAQVQAEPTDNGLYLTYLDELTVRRYLDLARQYNLQLIL